VPIIPNGSSSTARRAPMLAAPKKAIPLDSPPRDFLVPRRWAGLKEAVDSSDRVESLHHRARNVPTFGRLTKNNADHKSAQPRSREHDYSQVLHLARRPGLEPGWVYIPSSSGIITRRQGMPI
jgi:hypothetical protein